MRNAALAVYRVRGPLYAASAVALFAVAFSTRFEWGEAGRSARGIAAVAALIVFAASVALALAGRRILTEEDVVVISSPVAGRWLALNSPASKVPSHGIRIYGQAYAIDLVFEPAGAVRPPFAHGSPAMRRSEEYPAFGVPVFAMTDGIVVRSSQWRRDHRARSNWLGLAYLMVEGAVREVGGPGFVVGNHVVIRNDDGQYALVAHLQRNSVTVRVGDRVRAGQQVGRCGNSGNSSEPHVHAQLMDRASLWTAQGIPIAFAGVTLGDDPTPTDGLPSNGQHLLASPNVPDGGRLGPGVGRSVE